MTPSIKTYKVCATCIMDSTDTQITFDSKEVCSYCNSFENVKSKHLTQANLSEQNLIARINQIKKETRKNEYDCIMGVSGGVDSSYVAYLAKKYGLRTLAVHFDSGWNSDLAVKNIENIVKKLGIDLHTFVCDWEEMKDLQISFLKASLPNCDIPQDHAIVAGLFKVANENNIKYLLSGSNLSTEFILPKSWGYISTDYKHIKTVQKKFGTMPLKKYPHFSFFRFYVYNRFINPIKYFYILNHINYNKFEAKNILAEQFGWRDYGGKHYESQFTKFFQAYYLPEKFGFDKRKAHLSSLIVSGQISREEAMIEMQKPLYDIQSLKQDKMYVAKKLGLTEHQLDEIIASEPKSHLDYPSNEKLIMLFQNSLIKLRNVLKK